MRVVFRADASIEIGIGHIMRCLTLADNLRLKNIDSIFITSSLDGNLKNYIERKGYSAYLLYGKDKHDRGEHQLPHSRWLPVTQHDDAIECGVIFEHYKPDWIVVDNYALDYLWEGYAKKYNCKIMAIDDLADRVHDCDILVDQSYGRVADVYKKLVPDHCKILTGTKYSLIRNEFAMLRNYSLARRESGSIKRVMISMGGVDKDNFTGAIIEVLAPYIENNDIDIDIIIGGSAPSLASVRQQLHSVSGCVRLHVDTENVAQIMAECDIAIGAAGSTSWERCCLGLPTLMFVLADNQKEIGSALEQAHAVKIIKSVSDIPSFMFGEMFSPSNLISMSVAASGVIDGSGVDNIIGEMI
jgi:UDP-2,4-diacetamido-2,4,6-trideoxy-beta-L-altropyranose hydrolase